MRLFTTSPFVAQDDSLCYQTARHRLCARALVALVELQAPSVAEEFLVVVATQAPPSSSAFGANALRCALSKKVPFHRSLGGNLFIVRAFTTPLAAPISTVFDPPIVPKFPPCSNRESKGPRTTVGWLQLNPPHSLTELCQGRNGAPPSRPIENQNGARWWLAAPAKTTDRGLLAPQHPQLTPPA